MEVQRLGFVCSTSEVCCPYPLWSIQNLGAVLYLRRLHMAKTRFMTPWRLLRSQKNTLQVTVGIKVGHACSGALVKLSYDTVLYILPPGVPGWKRNTLVPEPQLRGRGEITRDLERVPQGRSVGCCRRRGTHIRKRCYSLIVMRMVTWTKKMLVMWKERDHL